MLKILRKRKIQLIIAVLVVVILLVPPLSSLILARADAGVATNAKVLINNSQAAATGVSYNFRFTTTVTTAIKQTTILICTSASGTCTTPTGLSTTGATRANDNIAGTGRTDTFNVNGTLTTVITTPASQSTQAIVYDLTGITNPSTINTTYYARITTYSDSGSTTIDTVTVAFAVLDTTSLAVTATVDPNLTFSIAAVSSGGTVNSATTNITTTTTTIPFGTLTAATAKIGAHDVTITTNAVGGYTVTASHSATAVSGNPPLTATANGTHSISAFTGTNSSPAAWSSPNGTVADTNTGFFGYTTEDATLCTGTAARFTSSGGNKWAGSTTTGQEVICSSTGVSAEIIRVGWRVEVNTIQPAGSYSGTVILVATPTY